MIPHMQATASHTANFKAKFLETKLHEACARYRLAVPSVEAWDTKGLIPKPKAKLLSRQAPRQANKDPSDVANATSPAVANVASAASDSDSDGEWDHQALHSMVAAFDSDE